MLMVLWSHTLCHRNHIPNFILEVQRNTHKKYNSLHKRNLKLKAAFNHFYELKTISTYALEPAIKAKKKSEKRMFL